MRRFLVGLIAGLLAGGILGLLFAPRAGKETQRIIRERVMEAYEKAREAACQKKQELLERWRS